MDLRKAQLRYRSSVAYVAVKLPNGDRSIGSAFHVGEGVFVTARHVVEGNQIEEIATTFETTIPDPKGDTWIETEDGRLGPLRVLRPVKSCRIRRVFFHPDPLVDVAAFVMRKAVDHRAIPLTYRDYWDYVDTVLSRVVIMGYPPIPLTDKPTLVATAAEVNAIIDKYRSPHIHCIVSAMARGGFSGGVAIMEDGEALGLVTEALVSNSAPNELGYMTVLSTGAIVECLSYHCILPAQYKSWRAPLW